MNKEQDKGVDDLFKKKLEDPVDQFSYREEDWGALEKMLGQHKRKKGIIYLLPVLSSVAALLLLFLGWWAFRPQPAHHEKPKNNVAINYPKHEHPGTNGGSKRQPVAHIPTKTIPATYAVNPKTAKDSRDNTSTLKPSAASTRRTAGPVQKFIAGIVYQRPDEMLVAQNAPPVFEPGHIIAEPISSTKLFPKNVNVSTVTPENKKNISRVKPQAAFRPQYALTVLAAPDINGVGSFQQSKVGTNVGLQFSVGVSKKFTIVTGAVYSAKPYAMAFENYHTPYQFPVNPSNVTADCRMLDIPLNVGYQLYNKQQNKISIGTGLSSYLMLHESYKFIYTNSYVTGPSNYTVPNSNKYFFGVFNLNATFEHQLNSKVGLSIEPYLKLPLTNLGYSQVRLQSTGVAVGLSWNLNSLTKP